MGNVQRVEMEWAGKRLVLETGRMAKLAHGAVMVRYAETIVLATVVASEKPKLESTFLPLTVDYQERYYASGKIPGGFFRREGRPTEKEILTSRLIDRPHRPLFPKGYLYETQIICSVLSADQNNVSDIAGIIAASAALTISDVPFRGPVGAVRIGLIGDRFLVNPDLREMEESGINLVVAGTREAIMMVEGGAREVPEAVMLQALELAHREICRVIDLEQQLAAVASRPKRAIPSLVLDPQLRERVRGATQEAIRAAVLIPDKTERLARLDTVLEETLIALDAKEGEARRHVMLLFDELERSEVRRMILERGTRADGRTPRDIRPISCEVGILPRAHGSALFTRGETQSLTAVTLGTVEDEQKIDALEGEFYKTFMLHYNFPPFSVGEVRPMRGPGRREIGHGVLAERGLKPVLPTKEQFPYTLRIVSDILESNGSSSMATVCASTLALMDAGVPVRAPVAGIAMGLIKEGERAVILSDILGLEDHLGDMDFKVTGTERGVTALQMDMKIPGITTDLLRAALAQAREGRLFILKKMFETLAAPRTSLSAYAPRIITIRIRPSKIGAVIGPGGKMIRSIVEKTGAKIDVADDGQVTIASVDEQAAQEAVAMINNLTQEVEVGRIYQGKVKRVMNIGAIVELGPNMDGLCHISELAPYRVKEVTDVVKEGDPIAVKVLEVDRSGKIRLSRKAALPPSTGH